MAAERLRRESANHPRKEWAYTPPSNPEVVRNCRRRALYDKAQRQARSATIAAAKKQAAIASRANIVAQRDEEHKAAEMARIGVFCFQV